MICILQADGCCWRTTTRTAIEAVNLACPRGTNNFSFMLWGVLRLFPAFSCDFRGHSDQVTFWLELMGEMLWPREGRASVELPFRLSGTALKNCWGRGTPPGSWGRTGWASSTTSLSSCLARIRLRLHIRWTCSVTGLLLASSVIFMVRKSLTSIA